MTLTSLCVYCGSSPGRKPSYRETAAAFGALLAREGITLVYGGGHVGMMGALADGALGAGGRVIGVIPRALAEKELAHEGLSELHVVGTMHERKACMADHADAFVALPGGIGTMEEMFEMLTWSQLRLHRKPCGFLDIDGFYEPIVSLLAHMVEERFVTAEFADSVVVGHDGAHLLAALRAYRPVARDKWIDREALNPRAPDVFSES